MNILGIDTSGMISSCCVMENGKIIGEFNVNQKRTHSETLVPMIEELLNKLGLSPEEVDYYAVGKGPGSFTGLRIGMTVAKTLAMVFDKNIIGVSTLEAIAKGTFTEKKIIPLIDARGGRVYYGVYQWIDKDLRQLEKEDLIYFEDLLIDLDKKNEEYIFVGDVDSFKEEIFEKGYRYIENMSTNIASNICKIAYDKRDIATKDYLDLKPEYIRKSQAQRDLEK
ncbi:tRNA (adenosine(37)-N6)-threonylcarbamoyltransferase complex dimerization subunit type 1 TsaB [Lagierella sp.]|uniref:tRNA (adenosine(37)-N6)-threonylcarbamoyltransferase complex dimerization subunit type 1 TsaB n=1 Tax=Lagierella sp. TaxID=2849657 RepID=UPI0026325D89|nr:tRNA (adenosine(37)-N6)-threonylcarbamoyltransferase complex dimerization subunit type 1 TsaB [Lagierella sp.]